MKTYDYRVYGKIIATVTIREDGLANVDGPIKQAWGIPQNEAHSIAKELKQRHYSQ